MKQKFNVTGMTCSACSAHVEKAVSKLPGVRDVNVNLLGGTMTADLGDVATAAAVIAAVEDAGYGASLPASGAAKAERPAAGGGAEEELREMKRRLVVSFCFLIPLFYLSMGHMMGWPLPHFFHDIRNALSMAIIQLLLTLPIMYVNEKYYKVGFKTLVKGAPNMDSLIAIGSAAAVVYGVAAIFQISYGLGHGEMDRVARWSMDLYFESAGMILTLITLGKYLEARSKGKTGEAISRLSDLTPKTATVLRDGVEVELPVEDVAAGDLILVRPGQSVPVDGQITEGFSALDESALTGESIPADKGVGDKVIAASINKSGTFTMRAVRVGEDTTLAQMIRLVEEASSSKAPIAKLADKVAGIFVPVVIGIAVLTAVVWFALTRSIESTFTAGVAVLVISCPCALGLATPVAIMVGTGKGAENGILIKSAEALETLHTVNTVVLDKTGTVTEGRPRVTDLYPGEGVTEESLLRMAAALEQPSEHPLAQAVVAEARARGISFPKAQNFNAVHGRGVEADLDGVRFLAGNRAMLEERGIDPGASLETANGLAEQGKTPLYFADETRLVGMIAVADTVKPTSAAAIQGFRGMGIDVVMLTGDNQRTADAIGHEVGVTTVIAEVLPQDKERQISALQAEGRKVAMVGDGINDAPALARADVGIAIGAGTDVAIESADIVLMKSDLLDAVSAVQLSKAVIRNIRMNLFWAFFYNVIGIPLAAGVFYPLLKWQLNPMFAAAAMSLSSVSVVSNALRLKLFRPELPAGPAPRIEPAGKEKGEKNVEKKMIVEGMTCTHCSGRVEKALNAMDGVSATVDLERKTANVTLTAPVSDEALRAAVTEAGYEVSSIS
ncbi:MAG: heavy metal translocating P-type ATPase [Clostridiales bacterium]|nr:heavy metal translocating P-type ATPase [Clostridiales bacterium]